MARHFAPSGPRFKRRERFRGETLGTVRGEKRF
jgi:hypothetical protein